MKSNKNEILKALSMISQFGISMIAPILLCTFAAKYLTDRFFQNHRYIIVIGIVLGATSSFVSMLKMIKAISKSGKDE